MSTHLEDLLLAPVPRFLNNHSIQWQVFADPTDRSSELVNPTFTENVQMFSPLDFSTALNQLEEIYRSRREPFRNKRNEGPVADPAADLVIVGGAGGADELLSLYAKTAHIAPADAPPHLVVTEKARDTLQNLIFRVLLARINPHDRLGYALNLLGLPEDNRVRSLSDVIEREEIPPYDAKRHKTEVMSKIYRHLPNGELFQLFEEALENVIEFYSQPENQRWVIEGLDRAMEMNPEHYLQSDAYYTHVASLLTRDKQGHDISRFHAARQDPVHPGGKDMLLDMLKRFVAKEGKDKLIDIAYFPDIKYGDTNIVPFLHQHADLVLFNGNRANNEPSILQSAAQVAVESIYAPGSQRYREEVMNRQPLEKLANSITAEGLPRTLFLANLAIGSNYADEKTMLHNIDIAMNHRDKDGNKGVDTIVIGGAIESPHKYWGHNRRRVSNEYYKDLGERIIRFRQIIDKFQGRVIYNMSEDDLHIIGELQAHYIKMVTYLETGKNPPVTPIQKREFNDQRHDKPKWIIAHYLWPYMLRKGRDDTIFLKDDPETERPGLQSRLVEMVRSIQRIIEGRPNPNDKKLIDEKYLYDTEKFIVTPEYMGNEVWAKPEDNQEIGEKNTVHPLFMRVVPNTNFSYVTQYMKPVETIHEMSHASDNGGLRNMLSQHILVDVRQNYPMIRFRGHQMQILCGGGKDDTRVLDPTFLSPFEKHTLQDPGHKRITIAKRVNQATAWNVSGDPRYRVIVEPMWPRVYQVMEEVQKTGKGFEPKTVIIAHDRQLGSITELVQMMVRADYYGLDELGATEMWDIGDDIQGRNYPDMPNENAVLNNVAVGHQQRMFAKLMWPLIQDPRLKFLGIGVGNHCWNTDLRFQGHEFTVPVEMLCHAVKEIKPDFEYVMPKFARLGNGDVVKAPFYMRAIGPYRALMTHTFWTGKGGGKGSMRFPSTIPAAWFRNIGGEGNNYDMGFQGHLHQGEIMISDNKLCAILGATAGVSGWELGLGHTVDPARGYLHLYADGRIAIELCTQEFFKDYKITNKKILEMGGEDAFIGKCAEEHIAQLYTAGNVPKYFHPFVRRELVDGPRQSEPRRIELKDLIP